MIVIVCLSSLLLLEVKNGPKLQQFRVISIGSHAVWILAAKLPNVYSSLGCGCLGFWAPCSSTKRRPNKSAKETRSQKSPSDFRRVFILCLFSRVFWREEAFLLTVGAFLLTVKLLCLQSLKALIRRKLQL